MAWAFIAVEMGVACKSAMQSKQSRLLTSRTVPMLCHQFWQLFLIKGRRREKLRIVGDTTPSVDVFVTCCKEDVRIITDTVRAAAAIDWPSKSFRVIVLDDGADASLKDAIDDVSLLYPNIYYTARHKLKGVSHHFKAGNLNHGLQFVSELPGGASTYIAALDADMIPEPEWLRAVVAHLVIEPQLALACPPQVDTRLELGMILLINILALLQLAEE